MTSSACCWPSRELSALVQELKEVPCTTTHVAAELCDQYLLREFFEQRISKLTPQQFERDFPFYALEIFKIFHLGICPAAREIYATRLRSFSLLHPSPLPEILDRPWPIKNYGIDSPEMDAEKGFERKMVHNSYREFAGWLPVEPNSRLRYVMKADTKDLLKVSCSLESSTEEVGPKHERSSDIKLLRYHFLLNLIHSRGPESPPSVLNTGQLNDWKLGSLLFFSKVAAGYGLGLAALVAAGAVAVKAGITLAIRNKVGINRSQPEKLTFVPLPENAHVEVAFDTWSSGYGGIMTLQSSTTWGYVRIKLRLNDPPGNWWTFPFDFRSTQEPLDPIDMMELRGALLRAFRRPQGITLETIFSIYETLKKPVPGCSDKVRGFISEWTSVALESLFPVCLEDLIKKGKNVEKMIEACQAQESGSATFTLSEFLEAPQPNPQAP